MDYYTLKNPSHWISIDDVHAESYTITNLEPRTTVTVLVRARNEHGLSPPSPVSKPITTLPPSLSYKKSTSHSSDIDVSNSFVVRQRLSQRIIELIEAVVIGSRKVKLQWEVRFRIAYKFQLIRFLRLEEMLVATIKSEMSLLIGHLNVLKLRRVHAIIVFFSPGFVLSNILNL